MEFSTITKRLNKYGLPGESLFSLKITRQHSLQSYIQTNCRTSRTMSFVERAKKESKAETFVHNAQHHAWTWNQKQHLAPTALHGGGGLMVRAELVCILKYLKSHKSFCPAAKAWSKLAHATGSWSWAQQQNKTSTWDDEVIATKADSKRYWIVWSAS